MSYFNENMSSEDARRLMFQLTEEMRSDERAVDEMWEEYQKIRPLIYEREFNSPERMRMMTS